SCLEISQQGFHSPFLMRAISCPTQHVSKRHTRRTANCINSLEICLRKMSYHSTHPERTPKTYSRSNQPWDHMVPRRSVTSKQLRKLCFTVLETLARPTKASMAMKSEWQINSLVIAAPQMMRIDRHFFIT